MSNKIYLPKSIVEEYESGASTLELAKKYNCSFSTITKYLHKLGAKMRSPFIYTEEMYQFIRDNITGTSYKEMTKLFNERFNANITDTQMMATIKRIECKNGIDACFKKGSVPHNKGKKWDEFMPKESQENSRKTCFVSGGSINNSNHNVVPVGTEHLSGDGFIYVKVDKPRGNKGHRFWVAKHHLIYEQHYGEIPKGHKVIFADGDRTNFDINNLICVSEEELLLMNTQNLYFKGHPELTKEGALISKIIATGRKRRRNVGKNT